MNEKAKFCNTCGKPVPLPAGISPDQATGGSVPSTARPEQALIDKAQALLENARKTGTIPTTLATDFEVQDREQLKKSISALDQFLRTAKPDLLVTFNRTWLRFNAWEKFDIQITNTGAAHALWVTLSFPGDFETRLIKPVSIEAGATEVIQIGVMPKTLGTIPFEISLTCKDVNGKEYRQAKEFWIEVLSEGAITPVLSDQKVSGKTKKIRETAGTTLRALPPEIEDKYLDTEFLGEGGFARVFRAKRKDGITVAIKIPKTLDESTGKSFIAELQNWTALNHANIVKVYDYNILPVPYFEEEFCDGSLEKLKKPMSSANAAWILFHVCEGLKYAHARKIIHRDLKPQNILLNSGVPKISDWGLSKVITDSSSSTMTSFTPYYAAPEQIRNKQKDQRTDIWQIGVILYEMVTGTLPFSGDDLVQIGMNIATKDPAPPGVLNPEAKDLEPIILKCLQKDPAKRYQNVTDLQKEIGELITIHDSGALTQSIAGSDNKKSAKYCADLLLLNMKVGDVHTSYKYASDLVVYTEGEVKSAAKELAGQLLLRVENQITDIPEELVQKVELIKHKIEMGLTTL
jgi:hypothetical protein